jgi:arginyl-tRNA--protein-N-Asp/Glu arginylyltransferase
MCSLGIFTDSLNNTIRDNVWKEIWNIQNNNNEFVIQKEFITRFNNYNPKYVINCCTEELTCFVTALLIKNGVSIIYKTYHPSIQWSTCKGDVPINIVRV